MSTTVSKAPAGNSSRPASISRSPTLPAPPSPAPPSPSRSARRPACRRATAAVGDGRVQARPAGLYPGPLPSIVACSPPLANIIRPLTPHARINPFRAGMRRQPPPPRNTWRGRRHSCARAPGLGCARGAGGCHGGCGTPAVPPSDRSLTTCRSSERGNAGMKQGMKAFPLSCLTSASASASASASPLPQNAYESTHSLSQSCLLQHPGAQVDAHHPLHLPHPFCPFSAGIPAGEAVVREVEPRADTNLEHLALRQREQRVLQGARAMARVGLRQFLASFVSSLCSQSVGGYEELK